MVVVDITGVGSRKKRGNVTGEGRSRREECKAKRQREVEGEKGGE